MKKKILLMLAIVAMLACAFALTVSAATADDTRGVAKYDTTKALYDTNGEALTWYVNADGSTVCDLTKNVISLSSNGTMTYKSDIVPSAQNVVVANFKNADGSDVRVDGASVVYFAHEMFRSSPNLTHIYIPSSLESLSSNTGDPRNSFRENPVLKQVWFPEDSKITFFGKFTFAKSPALVEVNIPKNVEKMGTGENGGWSIFGGCSSLEIVTFAPDSKLTWLPDQLFINCSSLKEIVLPNSVEYAQQRIFQGCSSLEKITLGYNFKHHTNTANDHNSFTHGATSLKEVYISANYYKEAPDTACWVSYVFSGGSNVKYFYTGTAEDFAITMSNFKNSTTNSGTNNGNFLNATVITKAQYEASKEAYATGNYVIVDCNPCEIFFSDNHLEDNNPCVINCERCKSNGVAEKNPVHSESTTIVYSSYDVAGSKITTCTNEGCKHSTTTSAPALFTCQGYSAPMNGEGGIAIGYLINQGAIEEYKSATGKSVSYGMFAVAQSKLGTNDIFDENGNKTNGALCADVSAYTLSAVELKIVGFADNQKTIMLAIGAYVAVTENESTTYSYMQYGTPNENESYCFVSYNSVMDLLKSQEVA